MHIKTINQPFVDIGSFSKFGSPCIENQDYFPLPSKQENYTNSELQRLYLLRASVILYCLGKNRLEMKCFISALQEFCSFWSVWSSVCSAAGSDRLNSSLQPVWCSSSQVFFYWNMIRIFNVFFSSILGLWDGLVALRELHGAIRARDWSFLQELGACMRYY